MEDSQDILVRIGVSLFLIATLILIPLSCITLIHNTTESRIEVSEEIENTTENKLIINYNIFDKLEGLFDYADVAIVLAIAGVIQYKYSKDDEEDEE